MFIDVRKLGLSGYKTYIAGILSIAWGVGGMYLGIHGPDQVAAYTLSGLAVIGVRSKMDDLAIPQEVLDKLKQG
jgi:hypothetical protein